MHFNNETEVSPYLSLSDCRIVTTLFLFCKAISYDKTAEVLLHRRKLPPFPVSADMFD